MASHRRNFICCASAFLLVALAGGNTSSVAEGNYYRWQDDQGNTILSDRPPSEGIQYEVIENSPALDPAALREAPAEAPEGALEGDPQEAPTDAGREVGAAVQPAAVTGQGNAQRCEQARANMEALSNESGPVTVRNKDGGARELSAQELQVQRAATQAQIDVYCQEQDG